jgi:hypothetical protein
MAIPATRPLFTFLDIRNSEQLRILEPLITSWESTAQRLAELSAVRNLAEHEKYDSASSVAGALSDSLLPQARRPDKDFLLCFDDKNTIQGCMMLDSSSIPDHLEIETLMTSPLNIESPLTRGFEAVHGVGRACILQAIQRCLDKNLSGLVVLFEDSAEGFYEHMGFTTHPDDDEYMILPRSKFAIHFPEILTKGTPE